MRTTFSINFYCRSSKANKKGLAPIEISVVINSKRVFLQLPRKEYPEVFKKSLESKRQNPVKEYLEEVRIKFNEVQLDLMKNNLPLTANNLKTYFCTNGVHTYTVNDLFTEYFTLLEKRVGVNLTKPAFNKYKDAERCFYKHVKADSELTTIIPATIENFKAEIDKIYKPSTVNGIMTKIKTVFMLSSGLSYTDTAHLKKEDFQFDGDTCFIYKKRQKTGTVYTSVILPDGVEVLKKYNYELPVISNQRLNTYLKEIQTICNIKKNLHCHLFRKTYGTSLLNKGVRLETVSKLLGHATTKITQTTYAKLLNNTIINEVKKVF